MHIIQTDRGEGQFCGTEIFRDVMSLLLKEKKVARVPDVLGEIVPYVGTEA